MLARIPDRRFCWHLASMNFFRELDIEDCPEMLKKKFLFLKGLKPSAVNQYIYY
ncbi:hypothetical protein [Methanosarcina mazei]|jgi:hypothetical protein|uniref:Uncharacterized protein n=1 Tax=Methanosarcina mazei Tuc01 TaxID=1236903 RepID=M1Q6B8_METMZ|nr:hypothetical protein [Methanosarcina mazei]AGF97870.1 hypothetical protein MmTuc01_2568 [Methanosarcina mazei Tuc01]MDY0246682.1 hypothetical protein [Methanosarcina mazei]WIM42469.1 hypothetical protein PSF70_13290 [Methanosarcina mazei]WIM45926.1 hypothetical protein PQQ20_13185 [Methanosarcina mazei]